MPTAVTLASTLACNRADAAIQSTIRSLRLATVNDVELGNLSS